MGGGTALASGAWGIEWASKALPTPAPPSLPQPRRRPSPTQPAHSAPARCRPRWRPTWTTSSTTPPPRLQGFKAGSTGGPVRGGFTWRQRGQQAVLQRVAGMHAGAALDCKLPAAECGKEQQRATSPWKENWLLSFCTWAQATAGTPPRYWPLGRRMACGVGWWEARRFVSRGRRVAAVQAASPRMLRACAAHASGLLASDQQQT